MKAILATVCGALCLLSVSAAKADITFCNNYTSEIWVAVGYPYLNDTLSCTKYYGTDEMIGWYAMTPGNCVTVFGGCYSGTNTIEFNASAADGAYWAGALDYGKLSYSAFDFCYDTTHCYGGTCPPFNYGPVGFRRVYLGNCGLFDWGGTIDLN